MDRSMPMKRRSADTVARLCLPALLALVAVIFPACSLYEDIFYFDDPKAKVEIHGTLEKYNYHGQTLYSGKAKNTGDLAVENVYVTITVMDKGGNTLGAYSSPVVFKIEEILEKDKPVVIVIINDLSPDQIGKFTITAPIALEKIGSEKAAFSFVVPPEE